MPHAIPTDGSRKQRRAEWKKLPREVRQQLRFVHECEDDCGGQHSGSHLQRTILLTDDVQQLFPQLFAPSPVPLLPQGS